MDPNPWLWGSATQFAHLGEVIPFNPELHIEMAIDTNVEKFLGAVPKAVATTIDKRRTREGLRYRPVFRMKYALKNRLRRQSKITRDPDLKAEVNSLQRSVSRRLNKCRDDQCSATLESLDLEDQSL